MNGLHILDLYRQQLADEITGQVDNQPKFNPLNIDPWLAMSLMQKAIRRGRADYALDAAATLLHGSPERLWRRLCVTAYEDIGCADFEAVALVTAALKGKAFRAQIGGEWAVASFLIQRMCKTVKCRATDDLIVACERYRGAEHARLDLTFKPISELLELAASSAPIAERALAIWYAIGTYRCQSDFLRIRKGEPNTVFDALCHHGFPDSVVAICREGFKKCNEILPVVLVLLERDIQNETTRIVPDDLVREELIGTVPTWAFDMHVREGNRAMSHLLKGNSQFARWAAANFEKKGQVRTVGIFLFSVESGQVDQRLYWRTGASLRALSDSCGSGLDPKLAAEGIQLLRNDLPALNEARRHVTASTFR